jgi:hypothetical protein
MENSLLLTAVASLLIREYPYRPVGPAESPLAADHSTAPVDFETQVIPVLTRSGCNSGSCHGAAIGRGGFKLSLLGYDPQSDFDTLVNEFEGRRVNRAHPEKSLLLRKPSLDLAHEGGLRLDPGADGFRIIREWIAAGVPRNPRRTLERIDVSPKTNWLERPGDRFLVQVQAHFHQGDRRMTEDVTRWSVIAASDAVAAAVDPRGDITALRRGQNTIMVRFLGEVAAVTVTVPIGEQPLQDLRRPQANFIDQHVNRTLDDLRLPHSPRTDDVVFIRRVYLDLIGALPDPHQVDEFVKDNDAEKRARLVEWLLARPEFVDLWSYKWGDLLKIESHRLQPQGVTAFHEWVRSCVAQNTPLDVMARAMLLAQGDAHRVGPANFHRVPNDARSEAEHVSRVFLGVRLQCANCHNHPLDRWTQDDYHGLAAVFARVDRGQEVRVLPRGEVIHPKTGKPATPKIPGGNYLHPDTMPSAALIHAAIAPRDDDLRADVAKWLTRPDNPFFARAAVNRIWAELMGRGLVEPVDDHRATNPATHPELLDALTQDFIAHGFDMRHSIRTIVESEAYQRSSMATPGNEGDDRFYSKAIVRPLPPHVLVDAVGKVTGIAELLGSRAIALSDSRVTSEPLDLLGRCSRDSDCGLAPSVAGSLPLTLHTINGTWLNAKIEHPAGRLSQHLQSQTSTDEIVSECYRIALSRTPHDQELNYWKQELADPTDLERREALEDFLWALLNSAEFTTNH